MQVSNFYCTPPLGPSFTNVDRGDLSALACNQRRKQIVNEVPAEEVFGIHIPQCSEDGRYYQPKQCMSGTNECWCVSRFGERLFGPRMSADRLTCSESAPPRNAQTYALPKERTTSKPYTQLQSDSLEIGSGGFVTKCKHLLEMLK